MITLIGKNLAKKGNEFVFYGPVEECWNCRVKSSCIDALEENRKYKIIDVKDSEHKCPVHGENTVVPVVVEKSEIILLTNSRNTFEGSTFTYKSVWCEEDCDFKKYCVPEGLIENDKCIIIENNGKHKGKCKKGYDLKEIVLAFVE